MQVETWCSIVGRVGNVEGVSSQATHISQQLPQAPVQVYLRVFAIFVTSTWVSNDGFLVVFLIIHIWDLLIIQLFDTKLTIVLHSLNVLDELSTLGLLSAAISTGLEPAIILTADLLAGLLQHIQHELILAVLACEVIGLNPLATWHTTSDEVLLAGWKVGNTLLWRSGISPAPAWELVDKEVAGSLELLRGNLTSAAEVGVVVDGCEAVAEGIDEAVDEVLHLRGWLFTLVLSVVRLELIER